MLRVELSPVSLDQKEVSAKQKDIRRIPIHKEFVPNHEGQIKSIEIE